MIQTVLKMLEKKFSSDSTIDLDVNHNFRNQKKFQ